jgi:hypothetical protein
MDQLHSAVAVRTIWILITEILEQIYFALLLGVPALYWSRVHGLIDEGFKFAVQERLSRLCSYQESLNISKLMREQWDEPIPFYAHLPSQQTEAVQKFSRAWMDFVDSAMNDCSIVMSISSGIIASVIFFLLYVPRSIKIHTDS